MNIQFVIRGNEDLLNDILKPFSSLRIQDDENEMIGIKFDSIDECKNFFRHAEKIDELQTAEIEKI